MVLLTNLIMIIVLLYIPVSNYRVFFTLNVYSVICQFCLHKTENKKHRKSKGSTTTHRRLTIRTSNSLTNLNILWGSKSERGIYSMISLMCGIEIVIQTSAHGEQKWSHRHRKQAHGYQREEGRWGGANWELGINRLLILYVR